MRAEKKEEIITKIKGIKTKEEKDSLFNGKRLKGYEIRSVFIC